MSYPVVGYAISGKAGAGKSTLGRRLQQVLGALGYSSCLTAFATELKREVKDLYGLEKGDPGGREALVRHGELMRAQDSEHWVKLCAEIVDGSDRQGLVCVIDDVRRLNEYEWARARGFVTIRLEAPAHIRAHRLERDGNDSRFAQSEHPNECELDAHRARFDYVYFDQRGTLDLGEIAAEIVTAELRYFSAGLRRLLPEPVA